MRRKTTVGPDVDLDAEEVMLPSGRRYTQAEAEADEQFFRERTRPGRPSLAGGVGRRCRSGCRNRSRTSSPESRKPRAARQALTEYLDPHRSPGLVCALFAFPQPCTDSVHGATRNPAPCTMKVIAQPHRVGGYAPWQATLEHQSMEQHRQPDASADMASGERYLHRHQVNRAAANQPSGFARYCASELSR